MAKGVCNMALNGASYNTKKDQLTARGRNSPTETQELWPAVAHEQKVHGVCALVWRKC